MPILDPEQVRSDLGDVLVALNQIDVHEPEKSHEHAAYHTAIQTLVHLARDLTDELAALRGKVHLLEAYTTGDLMAGIRAIGEEADESRTGLSLPRSYGSWVA